MLSSRSSRFQEKGASTSKLDPEGLSGMCETHMKLIKNKLGRGQFFVAPSTVGVFEPYFYVKIVV